jgi:type IV secretory pathway VirJ component
MEQHPGMYARRLLRVLALLGLGLGPAHAAAIPKTDEPTLSFGRFGTVHVYRSSAPPSQAVLFVSGDGGWNLGVVDMARALGTQGALVLGIDINHYKKQIGSSPDHCTYAAADFEALSQYAQKELDLPDYLPPILVGYSSGATLVYATLVQAPTGTFRGGVSLGFCPDLPVSKPFCKGQGLEFKTTQKPAGVEFLPVASLATPWIVLQGDKDQVCSAAATKEFVGKVQGASIVDLPEVGHGFAVERNWMPQLESAFRDLSARPSAEKKAEDAEVSDLPLVEVQGQGTGERLAVIVSGAGGWASLDRQLGDKLAASGVSVVGFDSLHYLWKKRTPDEVGRDLTRVLEHYLGAWHKEKAILIGYSLGADLLPFMASRLPPAQMSRVERVVLIGPSPAADFEFHVLDWLRDSAGPDALPTAPEVAKLPGASVLCIYGKGEKDSLCPTLAPEAARRIEMPGGHHFDGDYAGIGDRILADLR